MLATVPPSGYIVLKKPAKPQRKQKERERVRDK
jgi:hypothetical protein